MIVALALVLASRPLPGTPCRSVLIVLSIIYRIYIQQWMSLLITVLTMGYQSIRAALTNPAESLGNDSASSLVK